MRVLVAFERSGTVRGAFARRGHDVTSVDLAAAEDAGAGHVVGDALPLLRQSWDLVIAHPPCTYLSNAGLWANRRVPGRRELSLAALEVFRACLDANAPKVCVENPVGLAQTIRKADQRIQPWEFGDPVQKRTLLWLRGLAPLLATEICVERKRFVDRVHSSDFARSRFSKGIAAAMAQQWG